MSILVETFLDKKNIVLELDALAINKEQKDQVLKIIEDLAEIKAIKIILERLESRDKELFLEQLYSGDATLFIEYLREKIENVEAILQAELQFLQKEIVEDIRGLKHD